DHEALVDRLAGLEGDWICSYEDLPGTFEDVYVLDRDEKRLINSGKRGEAKDAIDLLLIRFNLKRMRAGRYRVPKCTLNHTIVGGYNC
ncbi:hypothetical protein PM022_19255, partial [Halorubrum ezzemoulense]|nr:hypothetical protein [Halorubrum ezzemoulense]